MKKHFIIGLLLCAHFMAVNAEVDPNFYIYLCFGQSNMEGQATPEDVDQTVDERFQMLATQDFSNPKRTMGQWYTATPPIVRTWAGLGMADYFGRTMVAALPKNVKVGVVDVAVGGIAIEGFMSDKVEAYLKTTESWLQDLAAAYGNNPYQRLVDMGKKAKEAGVIKGILLHQGESNNGQQAWLQSVKQVYESLLKDLGLNAADVPLFAGETVNADVGGSCSLHNTIIAQLPQVIPTAHVIPSNGCPCANDKIHFTAAGYRTMGKRYAYEALRTMGVEPKAQSGYSWASALKNVYELKSLENIEDITLRVGGSKALKVWGTFADGHRENLTNEVTFSSADFTVKDGAVVATAAKKGTVTATYTDFLGQKHTLTINVEVTDQGPNNVLAIDNGSAGSNLWDKQVHCALLTPMTKGKTYVVKAAIRADKGGDCGLWPIWNASTNRNQWGNSADVQYLSNYAVTSAFQEYTWEFNAQFPHDCLQFVFGFIGGKIYFDDVSCVEKGTNTEMVPNGSFNSDDLTGWSVLGYTGQRIAIEEDASTAGIATVAASTNNDAAVYTLQGVRVLSAEQTTSTLRPGLYIIGGKKIVKK